VRLVRALRFAAALDFEPTRETLDGLKRHAPKLAAAPGERIREELHKLMEAEKPLPFLAIFVETGLLSALLPDAGPPDLSVLAALEADFQGADSRPPETARALRNTGAGERRTLRYAALLRGRGAERASEKLETLAERLRWSRRETERARRLLAGSRDAGPVLAEWSRETPAEIVSPESAQWLRSLGASPAAALLLVRAAESAEKANPAAEAAVERLLAFERRVFSRRREAEPLLNGRELMTALDLAPSPQIGELLRMVEMERLAGRIRTRNQALDRIRSVLAQPSISFSR
jgi:tRNA nucleotidyltransferase/poly(A) polymerase